MSRFPPPSSAMRTPPDFTMIQTGYESAPMYDKLDGLETSIVQLDNSPARSEPSQRSRRSPWAIFAIQSFCFAWTGPIGYLLYLNFIKYQLGASAWCPKHDCWVNAFSDTPGLAYANIAKFAKHDEEMNNLLQYVAKLLEIWFGFIAGSFMYLVLMHKASTPSALPIRFLTLFQEFPDVLNCIDFRLWATAAPRWRRVQRDIWIMPILGLALFMGILLNLMSPAIATLLIPKQQWLSPHVSEMYLSGLMSARGPPGNDGFAFRDSGCNADNFTNAEYSCASHRWGMILDGWASEVVAILTAQGDSSSGNGITSQQGNLSFALNYTAYDKAGEIDWAPNRQMVQQLSEDQWILANVSRGASSQSMGIAQKSFNAYAALNNSLALQLKRTGPMVGATSLNIWESYEQSTYAISLDNGQSIQCFTGYSLLMPINESENNFTRCIDSGFVWSPLSEDGNQANAFLIDGDAEATDESFLSQPIKVSVYPSTKAVLLPHGSMASTDPSRALSEDCLQVVDQTSLDSGLSCNWTYFFSDEYNEYSKSNVTSLVNTVLFTQALDDGTGSGMAIDYVAVVGVGDYTLDPWPISNPLALVQTPRLPTLNTTEYNQGSHQQPLSFSEHDDAVRLWLDPTWTFAAWAVDWNDGHVSGNRTISQLVRTALRSIGTHEYVDGFDRTSTIAVIEATLLIPVLQTLSLIDYNITTSEPSANGVILTSVALPLTARTYVWAYGFDSKTARLGAAVAIAGCLIALVHTLYGSFQHRKQRSLTELLVAALAHEPGDDSIRLDEDEKAQNGMRFRVRDATRAPGNLTYTKVD